MYTYFLNFDHLLEYNIIEKNVPSLCKLLSDLNINIGHWVNVVCCVNLIL